MPSRRKDEMDVVDDTVPILPEGFFDDDSADDSSRDGDGSFGSSLDDHSAPSRAHWDDESVRRHLLLPHLISGYLQLAFNIVIISFIMYALVSFVNNVQGDIDNKVNEYSGTIVNEIAECLNNHRDNRCGTAAEVPVLRATCAMWERCMARDPTTVARTKLSAHTIGEILNNFVEPLSYKAMGFFTLFLFCFIIASNVAFKLGASKPAIAESAFPQAHHPVSAQQQQQSQPLLTSTPARQRRPSQGSRKMLANSDLTRY